MIQKTKVLEFKKKTKLLNQGKTTSIRQSQKPAIGKGFGEGQEKGLLQDYTGRIRAWNCLESLKFVL